jgi:type I restriction enzyme M protein
MRWTKGIRDPHFIVDHAGGPEFFLANLISKMKHSTPLGSRIAEVHNGSSF